MQDSIFINSREHIQELSKNLENTQAIEFICSICNQKSSRKLYRLKQTDFNLICTRCSRVQNVKKTKLEKYGDANFNNVKKGVETNKKKHGGKFFNNREQARNTCLLKYGVENPSEADFVKAKKKQRCLDRYGVDNNFKAEEIKQKTKETNLKKYGTEYHQQSEVCKAKQKQTCLKKYGVEVPHAYGSKEFKEILKRKYGADNYHNIEQMRETNIKKYGTAYIFNSDYFKEKSKNTCLAKYGVPWSSQAKEIRDQQIETLKTTISQRSSEDWHKIRTNRGLSFYSYRNCIFDSSWELALWIYAKDHNEEIEREPLALEYTFENKKHRYFPDFRYKDQLIELKGDQFFEDAKFVNPYDRSEYSDGLMAAKYQVMLENQVHIWRFEDVKFAIDYVENKYTKDFLKLFKSNLDFPYPRAKNGDRDIINFFHKSLQEAACKNHLSPLQAWQDKNLVEKSALNRLRYVGSCTPEDIVRGFSVARIAPRVSVFKPKLAKQLIEKYLNEYGTIFDPFSGFSGRLIGAFRAKKNYIGQDIHPKHVSESVEIIQYLKIPNCSVIQQDILTDVEKEYECLFTCPPYGGKEHWNENNDEIEKSCDEWIDICLQKYKCKRYLFVVDTTEKYKEYVVESLQKTSLFGRHPELVICIDR